jgi:hypothetical protein
MFDSNHVENDFIYQIGGSSNNKIMSNNFCLLQWCSSGAPYINIHGNIWLMFPDNVPEKRN